MSWRREAREAPEQPERDRGQLVVRIGEVLQERNAGADQARDHDAGQDQRDERIERTHPRRDEPHERRPRRGRRRTRAPGSPRPTARGRCRRSRRAPRPRKRPACRARRAGCGTSAGTRRRRTRAPRPRATRRDARHPHVPHDLRGGHGRAARCCVEHGNQDSPSDSGKRPSVKRQRAPARRSGPTRPASVAANATRIAAHRAQRARPAVAQQRRDLCVGRRAVIEARVELDDARAERLGKHRRMKDAHEPFDAEQPVERRRRIDPAERQLGRDVDAVVLAPRARLATPAASARRARTRDRWSRSRRAARAAPARSKR